MGTWEPGKGGGKWRAEALSEDQTGRNLAEVTRFVPLFPFWAIHADLDSGRMRAEHPPEEADTVIARGRVLGGLEPTRVRPELGPPVTDADWPSTSQAFGDARYKWPLGMQEKLANAFHVSCSR